jgi:hypothetical protein
MEEIRNTHKFWWGNLKGRNYSEAVNIDVKIILKWTKGNKVGGSGLHVAQDRTGLELS